MCPARLCGLFLLLTAAMAQAIAAPASDVQPVRVAVVAPDQDHLAWPGARRLQETAQQSGLALVIEAAPLTASGEAPPDVFVMPVRSLANRVTALEILELPFFYSSISAVHAALDGDLGRYLSKEARQLGWEILAYWDEGLHVLSGLKGYHRVRSLKAREFLLTRPDPIAEKQFRYWKATAERIDPENQEALLSECLVAGRAASLQEVVREQLYRVHLSMSLTNHRYEGWVVVAPVQSWVRLAEKTREELRGALQSMLSWQRADSTRREAAALAELKRRGMTIYEVNAEEREAFREALPDWAELLSDDLTEEQKRELIELASVGAAAVPSVGGRATSPGEPAGDPAPGAEQRQGGE